jgi:hypothetical protein
MYSNACSAKPLSFAYWTGKPFFNLGNTTLRHTSLTSDHQLDTETAKAVAHE